MYIYTRTYVYMYKYIYTYMYIDESPHLSATPTST